MSMVFEYIALLALIVVGIIAVLVWNRKMRSGDKPWRKCVADTLCGFVMILRIGPWAKNSYPGVILSGNTGDIWGTTEHLATTVRQKESYNAECSVAVLGQSYDTILLGIKKSGTELSPFGYFFINQSLRQKMEQRYGLLQFLASHPEIETSPVVKPIFITGLTRTGTTFLHDLLSLHPMGRSHLLWEQLTGIPRTSDMSLAARRRDRQKRYKEKKVHFDFGMSLIGLKGFEGIHRIGYDLPEGKTVNCLT